MKIVNENKKIYKFLNKLKLKLYLTPTQMRYLALCMYFYFENYFDGKMTNISNIYFCETNRSSINRFITSSPWDEKKILQILKTNVISSIQDIANKTKKPIELIIDDTISKKSKPSSKALNTIKGGQFHFSHTDGKTVYGHQIVVCILKCGKKEFPFDMILYNKNTESKIEIALEIIKEVSNLIKVDILLKDSWYASKEIIKFTREKDILFIGSLKKNRVIYPYKNDKKSIQIQEFVVGVRKKYFSLVTVNGKKYYAYRYTGKINGLRDVCIIITFPYGKFGIGGTIRAFITTDTTLLTTDILHSYLERWSIEVFIRNCKGKLGLDNYQMRSLKAIKRYYIISMLAYYYIISKNTKLTFTNNYNNIKNNVFKNLLNHVYSASEENISFEEILKALNVA
jgi:hypothetical protein